MSEQINSVAELNQKAGVHRMTAEPHVLRTEEVMERYKISRTTLHRWPIAGVMPPPRKVSGRVFWLALDLDQWDASGNVAWDETVALSQAETVFDEGA